MFDFGGRKYWFLLLSAVVIIAGIVGLVVFNLNLGVDFRSGSTMTIDFTEAEVTQEELRQALTELGYGNATIQAVVEGEGDFVITTSLLTETEREDLKQQLESRFNSPITILHAYNVSPLVAHEIWRNAAIAVAVGAVGVLLYTTLAFRKLPSPFRYGTCAIIALLHDVLIVVGVFALLRVEVNAMFIIGLLTVIGYSVNNTIVVFDRIRENMGKWSVDFPTTVNRSLTETLARSLNTSLTTLLVLLALFLFGGATIHNFVLVLIIGVISGTYSSIFIASQILVIWEGGDIGRFFRRITLRPA